MKESTVVENVMLDLETLGTRPGYGILSIGACTFDLKHKFYDRISPDDARSHFKENIDTLRWWSRQVSVVREEAFGGTKPTVEVLCSFRDWFWSLNSGDIKNTFIWGNGASFDISILEHVYEELGISLPWTSKNGRCYRTLKKLLPHVTAEPRAGNHHHALDDAIHQAKHASVLLQVL